MTSLEDDNYPQNLEKPKKVEMTENDRIERDKKMIVRTGLAQPSGNGSTDMHSKNGKRTIAMHKVFSILVDPTAKKEARERK